MAKKKKPSNPFTDPEMDDEYKAIEMDERKTRESEKEKGKRNLNINLKKEDELYYNMLKTQKYQHHLDSVIFKELLNADENLTADLRETMKSYGMKFNGQTKNEVAVEMRDWLINNYKYNPVLDNEFDIRNEINFNVSTTPGLKLALEKHVIMKKAYSDLKNLEKSEPQRIEEFKHFISENKEVLSKSRDTAFQEFMRDIGMKIASKLGLKDFAEQRLFKVHGKEFVKDVLPEVDKPKPGKK